MKENVTGGVFPTTLYFVLQKETLTTTSPYWLRLRILESVSLLLCVVRQRSEIERTLPAIQVSLIKPSHLKGRLDLDCSERRVERGSKLPGFGVAFSRLLESRPQCSCALPQVGVSLLTATHSVVIIMTATSYCFCTRYFSGY